MEIKEILEKITIIQGDITQAETECIVNAANPSLLGGGGVDGAIHTAAGPELLQECKKIGGCNHGEARITKGYKLKAKYIIHTPGPIYIDGKHNEKEVLRNSYFNSLKLAQEYKLKSIAFPAISTGIYSFPKEEAAKIAIQTSMDFINNIYEIEIYFVLFDIINYTVYNKIISEIEKNELCR